MTMSKSKDRKHQRRQRMGGEEHPHSPIQYQAFLKPNNSMAIRRETSHRRAAVVLMMCFMFITTCHHRCYAFSSHSYLSTRPLFVGHIIIPANSPRPLQTKHNVPVGRHRQLELLGHAIDEVDIRIRPNIFVIKTHEDYVKFLEEDDRLCVISELPSVFTFLLSVSIAISHRQIMSSSSRSRLHRILCGMVQKLPKVWGEVSSTCV